MPSREGRGAVVSLGLWGVELQWLTGFRPYCVVRLKWFRQPYCACNFRGSYLPRRGHTTLLFPTLPYYILDIYSAYSIYKFGDNRKLRRFVKRDSTEVTSHAPAYSPASLFVMVSRCWKMHTHSRPLSYLRVGSEQSIPVWDSGGKLEQHKHLTRIELCFQFSIEFSLVFRWFFVGFSFS